MSSFPLPDIAAMLILMSVLVLLRRKYYDPAVDLWIVGLTFILVESIVYALIRSTHSFQRTMHAVALDCFVLAAVSFGGAARKDLATVRIGLPSFMLPAVPMFALATVYGFDITSRPAYLSILSATLLACAVHIFLVRGTFRLRTQLLAMHAILWVPMLYMAMKAELRLLVYWGLACLYVLVALSFRDRVRRGGIGGAVIVTGFVVWAMCFLAHPYVRGVSVYNEFVGQIWDLQKFFVTIGMLLVLLEDQTLRREREAMHDPLTGLPNRRLFDDRLEQAIARTSRSGMRAALFVLDLNNFKQINDTCGHRMGDLVLQAASASLKGKVRSADTLARCGGDEFSVIVNDLMQPESCQRIAEALRDAIRMTSPPEGCSISISCSVGYAIFPEDTTHASELCEIADLRMYADKRAAYDGTSSAPQIAASEAVAITLLEERLQEDSSDSDRLLDLHLHGR